MKKKNTILLLCLLASFLKLPAQAERVLFSAPGGFYEEHFSLSLHCFYANHQIRYTTNGNRPTFQSTLYTEPLELNEHLYSTSDIYTIPTSPSFLFYAPDSVRHAIVIRAAVFDEAGQILSDVATHTYLIHDLGCDTHGLPVISIAADSLDLFGYETGILVPGQYYNPIDSLWSGNYYQSGEAWERRIHLEFYEPGSSTGINQDAGLRTHGGTGRRGPQKALKVYAREAYGEKRFHHKFFNELPNDSFKHLVLRPFTCHWFSVGIQDDICNRMANAINVESLASRPAVMFLNGEYWGIYYLREKPDAHYLEDHFGQEDTDYNLIGSWYGESENGDNSHFREMMNWLKDSDPSQDDDYETLCSLIDLDCFIDYYCLELFIANNDWPGNNMRCYQLHDGPWRWIFYDGDDCLWKMNFDVLDNATSVNGNGWPSSPTSTLMFRKLLQNPDFVTRFLNRFDQLMSGVFNYTNTKPLLEDAAARVRNEIPQQAERYHKPSSLNQWESSVSTMDQFLEQRENHMRGCLYSFFTVTEDTTLKAIVAPNPVKDRLRIQLESFFSGTNTLEVYNVLGQRVMARPIVISAGKNDISFDIAWKPGIYVFRIGDLTGRFIVM